MWVYQKMMAPPKPSQKQLFNRETLIKGTRQTHIHSIDGDCTNKLWPLLNTRVLLLAPLRSSCSVTFAQRKRHVFHQKKHHERKQWYGLASDDQPFLTLLVSLALSVPGFSWFSQWNPAPGGRKSINKCRIFINDVMQTCFAYRLHCRMTLWNYTCIDERAPVKLHWFEASSSLSVSMFQSKFIYIACQHLNC